MELKTAVVIDDEPDMVKVVSAILEDNGFTVRSANDARSGETLIREEAPDVILLDLMMPGRSGVQLFAKLRGDDETRTIPLIMVSGIKEEMGIDWGEYAEKLRSRKPDGFIDKPVDPEKLIRVINEAIAAKVAAGEA
jgi:CheY-like chemotaxis protein